MHMIKIKILPFTILLYNVLSLDLCDKFKTCNECIRNLHQCSWCSMDGLKGERCRSNMSNSEEWCPNNLIYPRSYKSIIDDRSFNENPGNIVEIKPQKYKFNLRVGEAINFDFSYREARDYPVDIYFLVDASKSMKESRQVTANESKDIYAAITNLTNNLSLGMGSFIDKNVVPFVNTTLIPSVSYSFNNRLKLTEHYESLRDVMSQTPMGENYDAPEGGLDGLAQVLVCKNEIGWRNESRKIIVFMTNGPYHAAGDAKMAGIIKPFDGKCYLEKGVYQKETEMDYPSVSLINKIATEKGVTVVFVVDPKYQPIYAKLANAINEARATTYKSNDMASILKNIYEEITKDIKIKIKSKHRNKLNITLNPDCSTEQNKICDIKVGQQKHFNGTIKVLEYIETDTFPVDIIITGISNKLTLEIDVIKECNCTKDYNSTLCNRSGNYRCGVCECNADRYGNECQCTTTNISKTYDNSTCIVPETEILCSGKGICHCGTCICTSTFDGQYCQYNSANCAKSCHNNGDCIRGKCKCNSGWKGEACDCISLTTPCTIGNKTCNDRGDCICGECICRPLGEWDARKNHDTFCRANPCTDCHGRQCRILEKCALCHHDGNRNCSDCNEHIQVNVTETLYPFNMTDSSWYTCRNIKVNAWCYAHFMYRYNDEKYGIELVIPLEKECIKSYYIFGGTILLVTVLIGLMTLIGWKLLTDYRDKQEYLRFIKERDGSSNNIYENPCFVPSTTMFTNLAYVDDSVNK